MHPIIVALLVLSLIVISVLISALKKNFKFDTPIFFTLVSAVLSLVFFVFTYILKNGFSFAMDFGLLPYAIPFGICFATSTLTSVKALKLGDLSLVSLVTSFGLLIPSFYGIFFLKEPVGFLFYIGLAFFALCVTCINSKSKSNQPIQKKPFTFKWLLYVLLASISNGFCSVFQTMQQRAYGGTSGDELMIVALIEVVLILLVFTLIVERRNIKVALKSALVLGSLTGIITGLNNFIVMMFTGQKLLPVTVFFPLLSGGGLIAAFIVGLLCYKEKYSLVQYCGFVFGVISVVLLNL